MKIWSLKTDGGSQASWEVNICYGLSAEKFSLLLTEKVFYIIFKSTLFTDVWLSFLLFTTSKLFTKQRLYLNKDAPQPPVFTRFWFSFLFIVEEWTLLLPINRLCL